MRKAQKAQLLEIIQTLYEAQETIKKHITKNQTGVALSLLGECQQTVERMYAFIAENEGEDCPLLLPLEGYYKEIYLASKKLSEAAHAGKAIKQLRKSLIHIENCAKELSVRLEVAFLPYKASMWDSLESIWRAADEDPDCDAYVVPIPYYDRNPDMSLGQCHYEGEQFPDDVPVVHYEAYSLESRRPDMIYIHNPYDENNYVTSIHPYFYSGRLKQFTEKLIYVPYCISGYTVHPEKMLVCQAPGIVNADIIILQSDSLKQVYMQHGIEESKLLVLGTPKVDAIVNKPSYYKIPESWKRKYAGRKCILLNTSISTFLNEKEGVRNIRNMMQDITANHEIFLIWRPHPLLKTTIASMRPSQLGEYCQLEEWIAASEDAEIDISGDALTAIHFSDGLISDYSSLIFQYIFTEKPILSLTGKSSMKNKVVFCDYFGSYFRREGVSIGDFIKMIVTGDDRNREERISRAKRLMANTDGSCGQKIYDAIKREI